MRPRTAACLILLAGAGAIAEGPRPTTKVMDCTASGCHAQQINHKVLHGPTAVSACDACHEFVDPAAHTFAPKRPGIQLCSFCHIDKTGTEGPVVHQPVAKGDCLGCHDPHGAATRELLKKPSVNEVCLGCHTGIMSGSHTHRPAAERCTACHQPHTSDHASLLTMEKRDLCLSCHQSVSKALGTMAHAHKPAEGDCLQCHSPHASEQAKVLKLPAKDLCLSCHDSISKSMSAATHPHSATTDSRACLNCHTPHASDHEHQLLQGTVATCLACHNKPIVLADKRTIGALSELAAPNMHLHGPVQNGECSACHAVHGGALPSLLLVPYAPSFYQTFSEDAYALCFKCHDRTLIEDRSPDRQTGFRNGVRNLHTVHVMNSPQGRSCRACHAVHASRFETLIADTVQFGQWKLPLNYVKTPTGGSCAPGCHKPKGYDRERAVETGPPPEAGPAPAPGPGAPASKPASASGGN